MLQILIYNFDIAFEAIKRNKLRSLLTSLGIIFGVASVIAMLAIGQGAQQEILVNMQLLGTNNIIIQPVADQSEGEVDEEDQLVNTRRFSPGLTLKDLESIQKLIPNVEDLSPEIIYDTQIIRSGQMRTGKLIGVNNTYFEINNFNIADGTNFTPHHFNQAMPVAMIGYGIRTRFFPGEDPIGQKIKAGNVWFTVTGVLQEREMTTSQIENLGIRNYNMDIYVPASTVLLRYGNRTLISRQDIEAAEMTANITSLYDVDTEAKSYHQIDRAIVRISDSAFSITVAEIISRMLQRRHNDMIDFEIIIPELLLQQEQRTKRIFNIVLASIASISLLVGGIGIMNIMLASIVERYKEIGIRRAVGAKQQDIQLQFLTEALAISITGGIIGIILGIIFSYLIEATANIPSVVKPGSIIISFCVATVIGIIFGYLPARRAAEQDPITSLRYE